MPFLNLFFIFICWRFRPTKYPQIVWVNRSAQHWGPHKLTQRLQPNPSPDLVDPGNLLLHLGDAALHLGDVLDVLLHGVQLPIVVELIHPLSQLLQLQHHLLTPLVQQLLTLLLGVLHKLPDTDHEFSCLMLLSTRNVQFDTQCWLF